MKHQLYLSWSGGKDSALALWELSQSVKYEVVGLLTTVTKDYDRISMHGVRVSLLEQQAAALHLPLKKVFITKNAGNAEYEVAMARVYEEIQQEGISTIAFGDIFLEDLKLYRENNLAKVGMRALFPLSKIPTTELVREFLANDFQSVTVTCDPRKLSEHFVGRVMDKEFFDSLPADVDPCGENGEYHSFVFQSPNFRTTIPITIGAKVFRDNFWFCDILSANAEMASL